MLKPSDKVAIYMQDELNGESGKMGFGAIRYLQNEIVAVIDSSQVGQSITQFINTKKQIPIVATLEEAKALGANTLLLGIAPVGGKIPEKWIPLIESALELGLSIINGLHDLLAPRFAEKIKDSEIQWIWDVRVPTFTPPIGSGKALTHKGKRVLFVGTDGAVGKMTTALELFSALKRKNHKVGFVATGQIGITVTGRGIPLDAYKVDYATGSVQAAVMEEADKDIILIEGQGSLLNPGSTATLPLMRGSCPTHLVLCMRGDISTLRDYPNIKIPNLAAYIKLNEALATVNGTYPAAKVIAVSVNTSKLNDAEAVKVLKHVAEEAGVPATDPVRQGPDDLYKALMG
jgi:uncharacterized NAD-dependent epimerase/dehydratase family protein